MTKSFICDILLYKEYFEELRNEKLVEVYHKTVQFYEKFADIIKNGGIAN